MESHAMTVRFPELGFYTLAGHTDDPRELLQEVQDAETLGLGSAFISERFNVKDAATLSGAAGAVSHEIGIATGATNHNTRHPLVTATYATTMHRLTRGRFALGLGRGFDRLFDAIHLPHITMAQMEDFAGLMRRLWRGETVLGHDGPAGSYPYLAQDPDFDEDIPILLCALGPKTLEFAGRVMDGAILHTFFTDETLARCVAAVRRGAAQAGRDPTRVRVWSVLATVGDHVPEELRLKKTVGRMATYLQAYGDLLVSVNGWDPEVLRRFREDPLVAGFRGALDAKATTEELERLAPLIPDEWLAASATGSSERCAERVVDQFRAGADGVILHGATPTELEPVVEAYAKVRDAARFAGRSANPGR
jgi:probable F420-dependent oxidoreductase